ncbi:peptide-N(4)-(N-acetyl-beta-glucosaminyl)asparagine amidase-like [Styela clava]
MDGSEKQYCSCVARLLTNSKEDFIKAATVLVKIARNIKNNPGVEKYKSIQVGSRTFMESLLPIDGAVQCLFEMGFIESENKFIYTSNDSVYLIELKSQLESALEEKQNLEQPKVTNSTKKKENVETSLQNIILSETQTDSKLSSHFQHVMVYENPALQEKARFIIPMETLVQKAQSRLAANPTFVISQIHKKMEYDDCLLLELLDWFKNQFFTWTDAPSCPTCFNGKSVSIGMLSPTSEEKRWGAGRVEGYRCTQCNDTLRFPRYNHPEKLLETRTGRCGEWANCFTLLCRSLSFDARHVLDWTDHVWTEVYSKAAGRWLHCDPCENECDKPLLYEKGWGKKLSIIVAASCDEIVDVTWRYTRNVADVLSRRKLICREVWLREKILKLKNSRMNHLSPVRRRIVESRQIQEMVEFLSPRFESQSGLGGRTTGSLEWREARGEMGNAANNVQIIPNEKELADNIIELKYFSTEDHYIRKSLSEPIPGWQSLVNSHAHIQRKVESDWKMVYLARAEHSKKAHLSWKIDLTQLKSDIVIKEIKLRIKPTVFQSGSVKFLICTDSHTIPIKETVSLTHEVFGTTVISIHAFLSGGEGDNAWQHTQLFRDSLDSPNKEPQLDIIVTLVKKACS